MLATRQMQGAVGLPCGGAEHLGHCSISAFERPEPEFGRGVGMF
jgi:hypothetical protein